MAPDELLHHIQTNQTEYTCSFHNLSAQTEKKPFM